MAKKDLFLPIMDIYQASFLSLNKIEPALSNHGSRVVFDFPNSQKVMALLERYNQNPEVKLIDYVSALRRLRSQMISSKNQRREEK